MFTRALTIFLLFACLSGCEIGADHLTVKRDNVELQVPLSYVSSSRAWWVGQVENDSSAGSVLVVVSQEEIRSNLPHLTSDPIDSIVLVTIVTDAERRVIRHEQAAMTDAIAESKGIYGDHDANFDESAGYVRVVPKSNEIYGSTLLSAYPPAAASDIVATCRRPSVAVVEVCKLAPIVAGPLLLEISVSADSVKDGDKIANFIVELVNDWRVSPRS